MNLTLKDDKYQMNGQLQMHKENFEEAICQFQQINNIAKKNYYLRLAYMKKEQLQASEGFLIKALELYENKENLWAIV